jgi:hypothetical protein
MLLTVLSCQNVAESKMNAVIGSHTREFAGKRLISCSMKGRNVPRTGSDTMIMFKAAIDTKDILYLLELVFLTCT